MALLVTFRDAASGTESRTSKTNLQRATISLARKSRGRSREQTNHPALELTCPCGSSRKMAFNYARPGKTNRSICFDTFGKRGSMQAKLPAICPHD